MTLVFRKLRLQNEISTSISVNGSYLNMEDLNIFAITFISYQ